MHRVVLAVSAALLATVIGFGANSADEKCEAIRCFGKHSYQNNCESGRKRAQDYAATCDRRLPSYQQCMQNANNFMRPCGCAQVCGQARCTKWPTGKSAQDHCSQATWR